MKILNCMHTTSKSQVVYQEELSSEEVEKLNDLCDANKLYMLKVMSIF